MTHVCCMQVDFFITCPTSMYLPQIFFDHSAVSAVRLELSVPCDDLGPVEVEQRNFNKIETIGHANFHKRQLCMFLSA